MLAREGGSIKTVLRMTYDKPPYNFCCASKYRNRSFVKVHIEKFVKRKNIAQRKRVDTSKMDQTENFSSGINVSVKGPVGNRTFRGNT